MTQQNNEAFEKWNSILNDDAYDYTTVREAKQIAYQAAKDDSEREIAEANEREAYESGLASSRLLKITELQAHINELREAGQALVDRWDTPNWKEAEHTGTFINALRDAIAAAPAQSPERGIEAIREAKP